MSNNSKEVSLKHREQDLVSMTEYTQRTIHQVILKLMERSIILVNISFQTLLKVSIKRLNSLQIIIIKLWNIKIIKLK